MTTATTTTATLSLEQRGAVLAEILRELEDVCPELSDIHHERDPGALVELYGHLDELAAIVRRTAADAATDRVEAYLVEVQERICSTCAQEETDDLCLLRLRGICVLSAHAKRIVSAIGRALSVTKRTYSPA